MQKTTRYIVRFEFETPVHIGTAMGSGGVEKTDMFIHSDTFFSALFIEILQFFGEKTANVFLEKCNCGDVKLSSLLPYNENGYFFPKPVLHLEREVQEVQKDSTLKKKHKNLNFIESKDMQKYIKHLMGKQDNIDDIFHKDFFGKTNVLNKVRVNYEKENELYTLSTFTFDENCGLYAIIECEQDFYFDVLEIGLNMLQYSGLGGERSSGYGKFKKAEAKDTSLLDMLDNKAEKYMLLALLLPTEEEILNIKEDVSGYKLIQRKGFIASDDFSHIPIKKKSIVAFAEGSCFNYYPKGQIVNVAPSGGNHNVYRYGKPICVGVM